MTDRTANRSIRIAIDKCIAEGWIVCVHADGEEVLKLTPKGKQKLAGETNRRFN